MWSLRDVVQNLQSSTRCLRNQIYGAMYNLKGRKVLVTGASRGLGAAIAKAFSEEGCDLAITYLGSKDKAEAVAAGIISSTGRQVVILQAVSIVVDDYSES